VLTIYLASVGAICIAYPPGSGVLRFVALVVLATALLTLVCWTTGAPPRWSWGESDDGER
jgi:hypothetical protein